MLIAIMLNAVVIFMLYFPAYEHHLWLEHIDQAFILLFIVEAVVKMVVYKPKGYFANNWNRFDFAIVVGSLPTLLINFLPIPNTSLLIVLRLFRLVRLVRFIRFIPDISKILSGLGRAMKASVFVLLSLVFLNFLLALITCHFYGKVAPEYFGDPLISAYSTFQLFTLEGWDQISNAITANTDNAWLVGFSRLYFVIVVLLGGIFGMSLANAVFVDEMTLDNNQVLEDKIDSLQEEIRELKALLEKGSKF
ncbi:MAG: ion transporter [Lewinella sp.]|nr:ion transporter [Lewinella sp.]